MKAWTIRNGFWLLLAWYTVTMSVVTVVVAPASLVGGALWSLGVLAGYGYLFALKFACEWLNR